MFTWDYSANSKAYNQSSFNPIMQIFQDTGGSVTPSNTITDSKSLPSDMGSSINGLPSYNPVNQDQDNIPINTNTILYIIIAGMLIMLILKRGKK